MLERDHHPVARAKLALELGFRLPQVASGGARRLRAEGQLLAGVEARERQRRPGGERLGDVHVQPPHIL
jgi:hypothetical protein